MHSSGSSNIGGWKMEPLKMYFPSNMGIFHCYVTRGYSKDMKGGAIF